MKVGVLTLPLRNNYGGTLQAYALQNVLQQMGFEVHVINRIGKNFPLWRVYGSKFKKLLGVGRSAHLERLSNVIRGEAADKIYLSFSEFIAEHINLTREYQGIHSLKSLTREKYDAIVVGSDQVWRSAYCPWLPNYFCDFDRDDQMLKIAYAASFGIDKWHYTARETKVCGRLARRFRAISVRESSAIDLCRKYLGVESEYVVDPTLLLDAVDYMALARRSSLASGNLVSYVLDETPEKSHVLSGVSQKLSSKLIQLMPERYWPSKGEAPEPSNCYMPIYDWLAQFHGAQYIVTDSFHGTIFSILFERPFVSIGNRQRGVARFEALLGRFGLEDRLIYGEVSEERVLDILGRPVDWVRVRKLRAKLREEGMNFLRHSLVL